MILFLLILGSCAPSGDHGNGRMPGMEKDKFFADPLVFYDSVSAKPRMDLSLEIPVENISFQKNFQNQTYYSKLIITVNVKNSTGEVILTKTNTEQSLYSFEEIKAKAKDSQLYLYNFSVDPGSYKVEVEVNDDYLKSVYKKSFNVTAKDFNSQKISFSDLMLLSKVDINPDGTREISPRVNNNVFGLKELFMFFEVYNNSDKEISGDYTVRLKNNVGSVLKEYALSYSFNPGKNQKFETVFILKDLRQQIPVETQIDMREKAKENALSFTLEILDKSNNKVEAQKKLLFLPDRPRPEMMNRQPPGY